MLVHKRVIIILLCFCIKILCWSLGNISIVKILKASQTWGPEFFVMVFVTTPCQNPCHVKELDMVVQAYNTCNTKTNTNRRIFFWLGGQPFYPKWWDVEHLMTLSQKEVGIISGDDNQSCFLIATQKSTCAHTPAQTYAPAQRQAKTLFLKRQLYYIEPTLKQKDRACLLSNGECSWIAQCIFGLEGRLHSFEVLVFHRRHRVSPLSVHDYHS